MGEPVVTVAIPSHDRPERLGRLLDALRDQTLSADRFEVIVCHDSAGPETERLLSAHGGLVRGVRIPHGQGGPGLQRNRAWRLGRAPLVAFIDDDCRPARDWLEHLLSVAAANPGAIVEGTTKPDPEEVHLLVHPHARTLDVDPPSAWGATCNILYPRELLERLDGFDEWNLTTAGEDTDLMLRALEAGAGHVGAEDALVWHAVDPGSLRGRLRTLPRWQTAVLVARRHPRIRERLTLRIFWRHSHARLVPALVGLALTVATRRPAWLLLALPWLRHRGPLVRARPAPARSRNPRHARPARGRHGGARRDGSRLDPLPDGRALSVR